MIVVLADDLSGAAEIAGVALRHGLTAEVQTLLEVQSDAKVVCVDTATRSLPGEQAAQKVRELARVIAVNKPEWIFQKCDSVLRGPVLAQARAIAEVTRKTRILLVSANPSRGRVVRRGNYFVEGVPLHETAFARDPDHPRQSSNVRELLGEDSLDVDAPDAETAAEMARHATSVDDQTLAVGGADLFEALLHAHLPDAVGRAADQPAMEISGASLLVCGSAASWSRREIEATSLSISGFALPHDVTKIVAALRTTGRALVGIGDGRHTVGVSSEALLNALAQTARGILSEISIARLLLEGGATAAAVMRAAGWTRLRASAVSAQGVGVLQPMAIPGSNPPTLFIKPGSYAWPQEVWPPPL